MSAMYDKNPNETIFMRILNLNPNDSGYWSNLINYARLLMVDYPTDKEQLEKLVYNFRRTLCEYFTPTYEDFIDLTPPEKLKLKIPDFWMIMMTMNNIDDYTAYFKDSTGNKITKHELEGELEKIKQFIFDYLAVIKEQIRFTQVQP